MGAHDEAVLSKLALRALEFDRAMRVVIAPADEPKDSRNLVAYGFSGMAMEMGHAIPRLILDKNPSAAFALYRPQFERVLRSSWLLFCAKDDLILRFVELVPEGVTKEPIEFPKVNEMIGHLRKHENSKAKLLAAYWTHSWEQSDSLHSYTHGGIRPLVRFLRGWEPGLLHEVMRISCTFQYLAAVIAMRCCARDDLQVELNSLRTGAFSDCAYQPPPEDEIPAEDQT